MIIVGSPTYRALALLVQQGPMGASIFGAEFWRDRKRGRTVSSNGGGDYGAQCFLGRLRKQGLVRTQHTDGSSVWEVTPKGSDEFAKALAKRPRRRQKERS